MLKKLKELLFGTKKVAPKIEVPYKIEVPTKTDSGENSVTSWKFEQKIANPVPARKKATKPKAARKRTPKK